MSTLLRKLFDIRPGEGSRALLMFLYIFSVISSLLILKPMRNSLFLTNFGAENLPYVFILVAVFAAVISTIYSRFAKRIRLHLLIRSALLFIISNLIIFWLLLYFDYQGGWFIYAFYVWVAIFAVITTSQFWTLANYVFNAREAKRLFGFVGAGAISGGIFGGYLTNYLAPLIGTNHLIFICIGLLTLCLIISQIVWGMRAQDSQTKQSRQKQQASSFKASANPFKLIRSSRHLTYLASIVGISVIVANLVDWQFNTIAERSIQEQDALTAFFGFWMSNLSIISLTIQLFFTSRILKSLGVGPSLYFLPAGILLGAVIILIAPVLWAAVLIKVADGSLKQSINKAGIELLVLPIPSSIKAQAKAFIDVFVDSTATGMGGVLLIIFTTGLGFTVGNVSLIVIGLIILWVYFLTCVHREYIHSFRLAIEKRTIDPDELSVNPEDASIFESLVKVLESDNERSIRYVLSLLEDVKYDRFIPYFRKLIHHPSGEIRMQILKMIDKYDQADFTEEASRLVHDPDQQVRTAAIDYLYHRADEENKPAVLQKFLDHQDYQVQAAALMCAAKASAMNEELRYTFDLQNLIKDMLTHLQQLATNDERQVFVKSNIARAIGAAKFPKLYPYLNDLLKDESLEVRRAAITSAGEIRDESFAEVLIPFLKNRQLRKFAREALAKMGDNILDLLVAHLNDPNQDKNIRSGIPRVMSLIGTQKNVNVLIENLEQTDLVIRFQVLKALNRLRRDYPMLKFNEKHVERKVLEETLNYIRILTVLYAQNSHQPVDEQTTAKQIEADGVQQARQLLIQALEEKRDANLERIFRLLGLKYPPRDMFNAYLGIVSNKEDLRANAVEFLDNILDVGLKKYIIPIVETSSLDTLIEFGRQRFNLEVPDEHECLNMLLNDHDNWLRACSLFLIAEKRDERFTSTVRELINSNEPIVKETAEYTLSKLE